MKDRESEECALLASIAQSRDRQAFDQLYERYSCAALNLARHVTGSETLAEEAFQNAMLRIWTSAHHFKPGNVRIWILRIVVRESIRALKVNQRAKRQPLSGTHDFLEQDVFTEHIEQNERITILRQVVEELPVLERQLVALHYGAGLSQSEIGASLSITQQAVSLRMKKALESLRSSLSKVGLASVVSLGSQPLQEALCQGKPVPAALRSKINQVTQSGRTIAPTQKSVHRRFLNAKSAALLCVCTALIAAVTIHAWPIQPAASVPVAITPPRLQTISQETVARHWTFNTPDSPKEIKVVDGAWNWEPSGGAGNSGCMRVPKSVNLLFDFPLKKLPVRLSFYVVFPIGGAQYATPYWVKHGEIAYFDDRKPIPKKSNNTSCYGTYYLTDNGIIAIVDGVPQIFLCQRSDDNTKLMVSFSGAHDCIIDDLKLESVEDTQVPDIRKYVTAFNEIPRPPGQDSVDIPEKLSPIPGAKWTIKFYPARDRTGLIKAALVGE